MPKPKIFISHSAKEDHSKKLLGALYTGLRDAGFDVLLDKQRLKPGVEWRDELNRWLWQCHGAVILFSDAALISPWVLREATTLIDRRNVSRRNGGNLFDVVPILLPAVKAQGFGETNFSPLAIQEIQSISGDDDAKIVADAIEQLKPLLQRFGEFSPFKKVQGAITAILEKIKRDDLFEQMAESFNLDTAVFGAGGDKKIYLANHALKSSDYGTMLNVLRIITPYVGSVNAKEFCQIVWPFCWVDQLAASRIPAVMRKARSKRLMAINSDRKETVAMYVRRVCEEYPPWELQGLRGGHSAAQIEEMLADVRAIVKGHLGYDDEEVSDEELNDELADELAKRPLVLFVPPPLPDRDVIQKVAAVFSQVTYILLSSQIDSDKFKDLNLTDVEFLLPELDQFVEGRAHREFKKLSGEIDRIPINAG